MEIKEITDKNFAPNWDNFVINNTFPSSFLQSWQWGQFRKQCLGEETKFLAIYDDNTRINTDGNPVKSPDGDNGTGTDKHGLAATALLIKKCLPLGRFYWSCPRGPIVKISNFKFQISNILELIVNKIKETAKKDKVVFVRVEPLQEMNYESRIMNYEFKKPKILVHSIEPENTLLLDLSKSEEEILQAMHQKTRYNIRLAERKGVTVTNNQQLTINSQQIDVFCDLLQQTAKRDKIKIFSKSYYEKLLTYFNQLQVTSYPPLLKLRRTGKLRVTTNLFIAEYNHKPLSTIIVIGFSDTATYLHGASSYEHRNLMPNYAAQWAAIKWAKRQGYKWYDFWGITPTINNQQLTINKKQENNWQGITRFKRGFVGEETGREINYLGTFDYVLNKKWYNLYKLIKALKHKSIKTKR